MTKFINLHPGGNKILEAAGGKVEPFWNIYRSNKRDQVYLILEQYRIGSLINEQKVVTIDPFKYEPDRSSELVVNLVEPFNAETPRNSLIEDFYTDNNLFFVRNH
ncbi:MAG: hypothetical protein HOI53_07935 [Francisellaceae bacterium]|nr:hypothetical protein [Francisellaceae bacterium]MBT6207944.1 hypothetical protein [Francisellaceae bacterium]MBT6539575.1 hypothetical protein [Francisellaceae bacterium]